MIRPFFLPLALAAWLVMVFCFQAAVMAGSYQAAGNQMIQSPINIGKNGGGYQIQICTSAQGCALSSTASKGFTIQIGILGDDGPKQTAAQLWAFYE